MVRLVRACGSKPVSSICAEGDTEGQARKSLWIETGWFWIYRHHEGGQARKSLWIETPIAIYFINIKLRSGS